VVAGDHLDDRPCGQVFVQPDAAELCTELKRRVPSA
jgi:hypothetical protein